jgi:hypothetical protein
MFADLLVHEVEVRRRSGNRDRLGQPTDSNPGKLTGAPVATYPCRLTRSRGGLAMQERSLDVFVNRFNLYTELGVDIREDDGVRVLDPDTGLELLVAAKVLNKTVASDRLGPHHLEFELIVQRGPA